MKLWKFYSFGDDYSMSECNSIDPNDDCEYYADVEEALRAERELTTLRQELGAADWDSLKQRAETAESECATLRAEVERLRAREGGVDNLDAQIVELRTEVERLRAELALESELATLHAGGASRAESRLAAADEQMAAREEETGELLEKLAAAQEDYQAALDQEHRLACEWKARYEAECVEHAVTRDRLEAARRYGAELARREAAK